MLSKENASERSNDWPLPHLDEMGQQHLENAKARIANGQTTVEIEVDQLRMWFDIPGTAMIRVATVASIIVHLDRFATINL